MSSYLPYITGGGGAIVVLVLWVASLMTGRLHTDKEFDKLEQEKDEYKTALAAERMAVNDSAGNSRVILQLIEAITALAGRDRSPT